MRDWKTHKIRLQSEPSQKRSPREVEVEALDFINVMRPKLSVQSRHPHFLLDMDQTHLSEVSDGGPYMIWYAMQTFLFLKNVYPIGLERSNEVNEYTKRTFYL